MLAAKPPTASGPPKEAASRICAWLAARNCRTASASEAAAAAAADECCGASSGPPQEAEALALGTCATDMSLDRRPLTLEVVTAANGSCETLPPLAPIPTPPTPAAAAVASIRRALLALRIASNSANKSPPPPPPAADEAEGANVDIGGDKGGRAAGVDKGKTAVLIGGDSGGRRPLALLPFGEASEAPPPPPPTEATEEKRRKDLSPPAGDL